MFVVRQLEDFPEGAQRFGDEDEVQDIVGQRSLQLNTTMCSDCLPMLPNMQLPHIFAHVYAGMEMLERGWEEWQMCQIVCTFMKENMQELSSDTKSYFDKLGGKQTAARYVWSLSRNFQKPDACQLYLFARACNVNTRLHFANCVWSTIDERLSYYIALDLALIGNKFVPLHSFEHETLECVVGEVKFLMAPEQAAPLTETDSESDGRDSDVDVAIALDAMEGVPWDCDTESGIFDSSGDIVKLCSVRVERLSHNTCKQLSSGMKVQVLVERVPKSALHPSTVFKATEKNKSQMFPGKVFRGHLDWTKCVVGTDKQSISDKKPGFIFSSHSKPRERPSRSSMRPRVVFWSSGVLPASLDVQLCLKQCVVPRPCRDSFVKKFNCLVCVTFVADSRALVKCHVESEHAMYTCRNTHCIAGFKSVKGRDLHTAIHIKSTRICSRCHQLFGHKYELDRHMVCHSKVRKHHCLNCG